MAAMEAIAAPSLAHYVGDPTLSDFTLRINGVPFAVLGGLLCMRSHAMQNLFEIGAREVEEKEWAIELEGVQPAVAKNLLEHCYGDPLVLTAERLQQLWVLSRYLQIDHVPQRLVEAVPSLLPTSSELLSAVIEAPELIAAAAAMLEIRPKDAGLCLELALNADCEVLRDRAAQIAATQLSEKELCELPAQALLAVVQTDMIQHGEDIVLRAVEQVTSREDVCEETVQRLLDGVRYELLSNEGLRRARGLGVKDNILLDAALCYRKSYDRPRSLPANPAAAVAAALSTLACTFGLPRRRYIITPVSPLDCRRPDSNWGLAFDVRASVDCIIKAMHCARGDDDPCAVRIFTCRGSYRDCANSPDRWVLITGDDGEDPPTPLERRELTKVAVKGIRIRKGERRGFLLLSTQFAARMLMSDSKTTPPCRDEFIEILPGSVHHAPAESPGLITVKPEDEGYCFVGGIDYIALPPKHPSKHATALSDGGASSENLSEDSQVTDRAVLESTVESNNV
eukprot:Hpha_TRINITY_DN11979_c0_g1::TRINITY_DN11979_c0_g1_i1::g.20906::m.20906